jgi:hypothetical protein
MTDPKPSRSIASHLAVFLLGIITGSLWHPCTIVTAPPEPAGSDEPAAADSTGP